MISSLVTSTASSKASRLVGRRSARNAGVLGLETLRDRSAWLGAQVLPLEPMLRSWLRRNAVDHAATDDIIHDAYGVLASLAEGDRLASARNLAFDTVKSLLDVHRERAGTPAARDLAADLPSAEPARPEPAAVRPMDLIADLPPRCREAFRLRKVAGLSQRDVAVRMGISEDEVVRHIAQALAILMASMKRQSEED